MKVVGGVNWFECPRCDKRDEDRFVILRFDMRDIARIKVWEGKKQVSCHGGHTSIVELTA